MEKPPEQTPPPLAEKPQEGGEIRSRWEWVEPAVWTDRMLAALETGVEGGKWFRLIDKVWSEKNLGRALEKVVKNGGIAGIDRQSVREVKMHREKEIGDLQRELREQKYRPQAVKRVWIEKLGSKEKRPLGIPAVRDRIVQGALRHVIEPIFEREFAAQSYGFRPGRGCKAALRRVEELLKSGHGWVVDADLKSYFDTIPHGRLMERVGQKVADGRVLALIEGMLKAGVMEAVKGWQPTENGTPQGAVISPLLSNIYLNPLDWLMAQGGYEMVRYADDFIILCQSESQAQAALEKVREWVGKEGLTLHPEKTRIVEASQPGGFDFLGYHFERGMKWPRKKSMDRLKDTIRRKTRRQQGRSMEEVCEDLNRTLRGWFEYFKHSKRTALTTVDGFIRRRLRTILRRQARKQGPGRGRDHQKWPNAYFTALGLMNLSQAHAAACQSLSRARTAN
jgi:RNA-directed DNA polymerase